MKVLVCIPARYDSTRFPAKVLAKETGKYLMQHTYEQACKSKLACDVIIATDSRKVYDAAKSFASHVVMTSTEHQSGTDRIAEAVADIDADIVINVQADEPEMDPANIDVVASLLVENKNVPMATLATDFDNVSQISDPNTVKVVVDNKNRAIYFSRSPIPFDRQNNGIGPIDFYLRHLGIYAYRKSFLINFTKLPLGRLEQIEKLEQLRAIENGYEIIVAKVKHPCEGIDTPEQYNQFVERYKMKLKKGASL